MQDYEYQVTNINIDDGIIDIKSNEFNQFSPLWIHADGEPDLYIASYPEITSVKWAVANLTCQEAQFDISRYACISINSNCLIVTTMNGFYGYRCKCASGFQGNPYVQKGCQSTLFLCEVETKVISFRMKIPPTTLLVNLPLTV